ncbi:MAG TPA: ribose-phosphate diphosphokinase, partial [Acidimicrobiales bacterium]|nr:ribose-phosphate diphosphokinase [Acidimicrobiales bacterium]
MKKLTMSTDKQLYVVSGRSHPELAEEIATCLGVELGEPNLSDFANGEIHGRYSESIRGADVFIVQSHTDLDGFGLNDSVMEQLIMVDAAKRASAKRISVVCPYYGYARQDRKAEGREPISARLLADLFKVAGANRLISVDLHSGQIQGFFDGPVDHLTAAPVLLDYCRTDLPDNLVVVSPDTGRVKVAEKYANKLGADIAIVHKRHVKGQKNAVEAREVIGEVEGRPCVLLDDMIDTAGTIVAAADILLEHGATAVWAMCTHGLLSDPAVDRLKNSPIERVVMTNTVP